MFGSKLGGAAAYSKVGLETGVVAASPHKLIVMLFDGAIEALRIAREQMQARNIVGKGNSITKAITIISGGLRASLDHNSGGEIAANLDALYDYTVRRLVHAHVNNNVEALDEVHALLVDLRETWNAIGDQVPQAQPAAAAPALDPLAPRAAAFVSA